MTELDENISVDSDDDDDSDDLQDGTGYSQGEKRFPSDAERRAHHNALERKRRDHIKECFNHLRDSIPTLQGEKPSRAQILNKAAEYVRVMQQKKQSHWQEIATLKRQIRELEKAEKELGQDYSPEVNVDSESDEDSSDADKSFHL